MPEVTGVMIFIFVLAGLGVLVIAGLFLEVLWEILKGDKDEG